MTTGGMGDDFNRHDEPPRSAPTQPLTPEPPGRTETRLLHKIFGEVVRELVIPPLAELETSRRPRKPQETILKIDLGTLEGALRKLGLDPGPR
jgi:hypothetical protein